MARLGQARVPMVVERKAVKRLVVVPDTVVLAWG